MNRRDFITLLGGTTAWPLAARAQQSSQTRHVGMLIATSESENRVYTAGFKETLAKLGWLEGHNLRIDIRFGEGNAKRASAEAAELVRLSPDVIFAVGLLSVRMLQQET